MDKFIQIQNVTRQELVSIIENTVQSKLNSFLSSKEPETLTIKETAELLSVSTVTIHSYIRRGLFPASKIGRRIVIKREDIEKALKEVKSLKYKR